jgi:hypothetical protein
MENDEKCSFVVLKNNFAIEFKTNKCDFLDNKNECTYLNCVLKYSTGA